MRATVNHTLHLKYDKQSTKQWFNDKVQAAYVIGIELVERYREYLTISEYMNIKNWGLYQQMEHKEIPIESKQAYERLFELILGDKNIVWDA